MVLGAMFGYMLEWTGSLWTPIIAHFINNGSAVLIYFFTEKNSLGESSEQVVPFSDGSFLYALLSAMFLYAFFRALYAQRAVLETAALADEWVYPNPNEDDELEKELK
jgi:hypothetical protein